MHDLGFDDDEHIIQTLRRTNGDVNEAVGLLTRSLTPKANRWVLLHEDPDNLCVLVKGEEQGLSSQQRDDLLRLRAGKKVVDSLSIDENNRLWYQPPTTAATQTTGVTQSLFEVVEKGGIPT